MKYKIAIIIVVIGLAVFSLSLFFNKTTSGEVLDMIVADNENAVISVGLWEDGAEKKYIYTKDGMQDFATHKYQVGSVTKTFTGAMLAKEVYDGRISIDDFVSKCLDFEPGSYDPTFRQLVTHRSGLSTLWDDMLAKSDNIFEENFSRQDMIRLLANARVEEGEHSFDYSNFGTGLVGTAVANHIDPYSSYQEIMNGFLVNQLGLNDTCVGGNGDFADNYQWSPQDEMMAAGAIVSSVPDLLEYGKKYLSDSSAYDFLDLCTTSLGNVDKNYDIGYFWLIDKKSGMIWHNGEIAYERADGTEVGYQAFLGIDPKKNKVVVVLYNGISYYEDDALTDLLGMLLMEEE